MLAYILFVMLPGLVIAGAAQLWLRSAISRGQKVESSTRMTGAQAAREILDHNGLNHIQIEQVGGYLSDHYDPRSKVVRLSPAIYQGTSLASLGVAAHEVGHALQDAKAYGPLVIRNAAVPVASIGSNLSFIVLLAGLFLNIWHLAAVGVLLFLGVVIFQLINLPVEFNASTRARQELLQYGMVNEQEVGVVRGVLRAAAMTYVAGVVTSVLTLLYYIMLLAGGRD